MTKKHTNGVGCSKSRIFLKQEHSANKLKSIIKKKILLIIIFTSFLIGCNINPNKEARIQKLEAEIQTVTDRFKTLENRVQTLEVANEQLQKRNRVLEKTLE